jgi:hypothetical protein
MQTYDHTRRNFLKMLALQASLIAVPSVALSKGSQDSELEEIAKNEATRFSESLPKDKSAIERLILTYEIHLRKLGIEWRATADLLMQKRGGQYQAILQTKPQGLLTQLTFAAIGHVMPEVLRSIKMNISETFSLDQMYKTHLFEQEVIDSTSGDRSALRVRFDYNDQMIRFWKNAQCEAHVEMPYTCQTGPITGFFNYIFFHPAETQLTLIKPTKQKNAKHEWDYEFRNEIAEMRKADEHYRVIFDNGNFLDMIEGNVKYHLNGGGTNVPFFIGVDGITNLKNRQKRARVLQELLSQNLPQQEYEEKRNEIMARDYAVARKIRVYLTSTKVT